MKILCLDDDELVRTQTVSYLRELGHEVLEADKGADAMQWIRQCGDKIDLLVLDIRMPSGPDGRQVTSYARQRHPDMPVIYCTAYQGREAADPTRDWFLSKPYSPHMLANAVANIAKIDRHANANATSDRLSGPARWTQA